MKKLIIFSLFFACCALFNLVEAQPRVILRGDYPDPTIIRDGKDYYMTHSACDYFPGFLIWHSTDLVNWKPLTRALHKIVGSVWAPDLVKHNGRYYIYFPANKTNWVMWADKMEGPWSEPIDLKLHDAIDPGHAVDEDGNRYLFVSAGKMINLSPDGLSATGNLQQVYDGWEYPKEWKTECMCLESPKLIHHGDYFYMISAQGGTAGPATSHMIVAARARSVLGPWENSPNNPIVHTYSPEEQWWSKGHGTLIDDRKGNWWVVYHAYEKGYYTLGRSTLIEPIEWTPDGWFRLKNENPLLNKHGKEKMKLSDNFRKKKLGLQWTFWKDSFHPEAYELKDRKLYLQGRGEGVVDAEIMPITAYDKSYRIDTEVTLNSDQVKSGLLLFYSEKGFSGVLVGESQLIFYKDGKEKYRLEHHYGKHFHLRLLNEHNRCTIQISNMGMVWETLASGLDVSALQHNKLKNFLALRPALVASGKGSVAFHYFRYREQ